MFRYEWVFKNSLGLVWGNMSLIRVQFLPISQLFYHAILISWHTGTKIRSMKQEEQENNGHNNQWSDLITSTHQWNFRKYMLTKQILICLCWCFGRYISSTYMTSRCIKCQAWCNLSLIKAQHVPRRSQDNTTRRPPSSGQVLEPHLLITIDPVFLQIQRWTRSKTFSGNSKEGESFGWWGKKSLLSPALYIEWQLEWGLWRDFKISGFPHLHNHQPHYHQPHAYQAYF